MRTIEAAHYTYDSGGRLRAAWDPRLDWVDTSETPHVTRQVQTVYGYNSDGILATINPPGQEPWQLAYTTVPADAGTGRLASMTRSALAAGTAVSTVVYRVPVSGAGAPYDLSATQTARWGQTEAPTDAAAVFPPTQIPDGNHATGVLPSSYEYAGVTYLDANGRIVKTAAPGGGIGTTWLDLYGNSVQTLTAGNRRRALDASGTDTPSQFTTPAADTLLSAGGDSTMTYHVNDMARTIAQSGRTTTHTLDVNASRFRAWTDNGSGSLITKTHHYTDDGDSPAWTAEGDGTWTRVVPTTVGVAAIQIGPAASDLYWQITNLHGDLVAGLTDGTPGLAYTSEATEYGQLRNPADTGSNRYGWLGQYQRAVETPDGGILMGVRRYNPTLGRFGSIDPVYGGSCNRYEYVCGDPTNRFDLDGKYDCRFALLGCFGTWVSRKIQSFQDRSVKAVRPWILVCLGYGFDGGLAAGGFARFFEKAKWLRVFKASGWGFLIACVIGILHRAIFG